MYEALGAAFEKWHDPGAKDQYEPGMTPNQES